MAATPTSERVVTIHYVDAQGMDIARQRISLGLLSRTCFRGKTCPLGLVPGQKCQVSARCTMATPEAWAQYLRLNELDELGR